MEFMQYIQKTVAKVPTSCPGFEVLKLFPSLYIFGTIKLMNGNRCAIPLNSHPQYSFHKHADVMQTLRKTTKQNFFS